MKKKYYHFIFSMGGACSCASTLIRKGLRKSSGPFDWIAGSDFIARTELFTTNFAHFIDKDDLTFTGDNNGDKNQLCDIYQNNRNQLMFIHDFPTGIPFNESYPIVRQKYERRIKRLIDKIKTSETVLLVFIEPPNQKKNFSASELTTALKNIQGVFPNTKIDLLYLTNCPKSPTKTEYIGTDITRIYADYTPPKKNAKPHAVSTKKLNQLLTPYRLNQPLWDLLGWWTKKILISIVPIKSYRHRLKNKYHY